jgi:septal ring-binding cell division protein DamX
MRLIYSVAALMGVLAISACTHHNGAHQSGGHGFAAKNYGLTYEQVREAAQDGDADAQYALGYMYYYGQNVTRNGKQARFWIGKAAAQNHQQAIRALKMMGAQSHYANRDSLSRDSAQASPGRHLASGENSWQEVRRPQEVNSQPERFRPQAQNGENQGHQFKVAADNADQSDNASLQLSKGRTSAHDAHDESHAISKAQLNGEHHAAAEKKVAVTGKKHRRAELHKKSHGKQLASKLQGTSLATASAENPNASAIALDDEADAASSVGGSSKGLKNTSGEEPSLESAQQKNSHPAQKTASNRGKSSKAQLAHSHHAKSDLVDASAKGSNTSKGNAKLSSDERTILSAPTHHYTLQLIGSSSKAAIQKVMASNHLQQKAKVYHAKVKGKDFYGLIYGSYPSQTAANDAIAHLPANLQQLKPWAKPYASVKASINAVGSETGKRTG